MFYVFVDDFILMRIVLIQGDASLSLYRFIERGIQIFVVFVLLVLIGNVELRCSS